MPRRSEPCLATSFRQIRCQGTWPVIRRYVAVPLRAIQMRDRYFLVTKQLAQCH